MKEYYPQEIEKKWQEIWEESGLYRAKDNSNITKYYCLDMFPYPSASGLHVGHWRGYVLSDMIARYQRLKGKNVLHPMGYDAFGLPAENAAIKAKSHPQKFTEQAIKNFRRQIKQIGTMIDWSREVNTSRPEYYKWTQWLFLQLYKNGLAYRKKAPVNWCPSCQTVLANEQVVSGECERCGSNVIKKDLTQWFFKITQYAEELLNDLDNLDWPERTKQMQRNWIGRSEGAVIKFEIQNPNIKEEYIEVFTTRADTLYGCTYIVLAPEHAMIEKLKAQISNIKEVEGYIDSAKNKSDLERTELQKEKTGVELEGIKAINPINSEEISVWVADYALINYGTGAVMCVPAHDQRDYEFAKKFNLPVKQVIVSDDEANKDALPFCDYGQLINSNSFDGLTSKEAMQKIAQKLKENDQGEFSVNYRLRDWLISRQRYWGAPIPIIYCEKCGEVAVPEQNLPVKLPDDVEFKPQGESPLKSSDEFLNTTCPNCGEKATRETDTMDTFVDSSWYYLRYIDQKNDQEFASQEKIKYWMPIDTYVGGIEHAILHLLYARFISKALTKLKIVNYTNNGEPFNKLFNIGMIYLHGAKMSKSKGNVVSPDELIEKYGTDALRGYELFIGPADQDSEWQVQGIAGVRRFLEKVWRMYDQDLSNEDVKDSEIENTIKIVTQEIESIHPNTAISHLMTLFNYLKQNAKLSKSNASKINILLAPFFPHLAEELWLNMGNTESVFKQSWPDVCDKNDTDEIVTIGIQINGKFIDTIKIKKNLSQKEVEKLSQKNLKVSAMLQDKKISKIIYVSGRILSFVIK